MSPQGAGREAAGQYTERKKRGLEGVGNTGPARNRFARRAGKRLRLM